MGLSALWATSYVLSEVEDERASQREKWGNDHDDQHAPGFLAEMAKDCLHGPHAMPTVPDRRALIQAAALIVAEVERIDRATPPQAPGGS